MLAILHVILEQRVGQELAIGRGAKQAATDHDSDIGRHPARNARRVLGAIILALRPQDRARAFIGQAGDHADRVADAIDRPAERIGGRRSRRGGGRFRHADHAVRIERRRDLGAKLVRHRSRQVRGDRLEARKPHGQGMGDAMQRAKRPPQSGGSQDRQDGAGGRRVDQDAGCVRPAQPAAVPHHRPAPQPRRVVQGVRHRAGFEILHSARKARPYLVKPRRFRRQVKGSARPSHRRPRAFFVAVADVARRLRDQLY